MKLSYLTTTLIIIFSFVTFFSINHGPTRQTLHNDFIQDKEKLEMEKQCHPHSHMSLRVDKE